MTMNVIIAISPLLALLVGGLVLMMNDAFSEEPAGVPVLGAAVLGVTAALSAGLFVSGQAAAAGTLFGGYLVNDPMSLFVDVAIGLGGALTCLLAGGYFEEHGDERGEFYVLVVFSAFGAMVLGRATDLISLFIGLETMSLGVYCLAGFRRTSSRSAEGALKYFLLGSFAAAILLFGSALLYGASHTTSFKGIADAVSAGTADPSLVLFGLLMLIVGLAFKVSAVPFHMWTPDAYEGAPTPATTFMAVAVKSAAFAVLARVLLVAFGSELLTDAQSGWPPLLGILAAITMVYGNVAAIAQTSVKRMLAYSSIAHAGYLLVGLAATVRTGSTALSAVLFYLLAYTVSNVLAFGALIVAGSHGKEAVSYEDLAGLGRRHPIVAVPFVIGILSLMGFPPTAGFFAKYYVFSAAVAAGGWMVGLAILGMLASAVGAYYYLRVLVFLFMKEPRAGAAVAVPMRSTYVASALSVSAIMVMALGLMPSGVLRMAVEAATHLLPNA
ncbi:MAG: NADH-quinone oxidoreductase subunit N [Polyangiales bacterium]